MPDQNAPWQSAKPDRATWTAQERYLVFDTIAQEWLAAGGSTTTRRVAAAQRYSRTSAVALCTQALHLSTGFPVRIPVREADVTTMIRVYRNQAPGPTGWQ